MDAMTAFALGMATTAVLQAIWREAYRAGYLHARQMVVITNDTRSLMQWEPAPVIARREPDPQEVTR